VSIGLAVVIGGYFVCRDAGSVGGNEEKVGGGGEVFIYL